MSLEAQLQANTTAVLKLCAILEARADGTVKDVNKDATAKPAASKTVAAPAKPAIATAGSTAPKTYDDIKKAANALIVKHGRDAFLKVLEGFQLKTAMEAKPEEYPELLAAIAKASA